MNVILKAFLISLLLCCSHFLLLAQPNSDSKAVAFQQGSYHFEYNYNHSNYHKDYNYNVNSHNYVYNKPRYAKLGVYLEKDETGVRITKVSDNSAAEAAGLEAGDRLIAFGGVKIWGKRQLVAMIKHYEGGEDVRVDYQRDGQVLTTTATLEQVTNRVRTQKAFQSPCEKAQAIYGRPFLGVYLDRSQGTDKEGARITSIIKNTGAAASSLQAEDRIITLDGVAMHNSSDVHYLIQRKKKPTEPMAIEVLREGKRVALTAIVGSWGDRQDMQERLVSYEEACEEFNDPAKACATLQELQGSPFLGVYMSNVSQEYGGGALINSVIEGTQAAQTNLRGGDKIVRFNGVAINSHPDATNMILNTQPGEAVKLQVLRGDQLLDIEGTMGSRMDRPTDRQKVEALSEICDQQDEQPNQAVASSPKDKDSNPTVTTLENENISLTLFPNPASDVVNVVYEGQKGDLVVSITTIDGKSMYNKKVPEFEGIYQDQIDVNTFPAGIYILYITQGDVRTSKQLVVE